MNLTTLDEITRRGLLDNGLPIHFYFEYLNHAANCLRELNFDTLQIINAANLPIGDYGQADLPDDFSDDLGVFVPVGSLLAAVPKQNLLTPLRVHNTTTGAFEPYTTEENEDGVTVWGMASGQFNYYYNVDDYGQSTGRQFGGHGGTESGYKIIKARRQIQMTDDFIDDNGNSNIVLLYISNGQSVSAASQIDYMAFSTIRSWQDWKASPNRNNEFSPEGRYFYNQKRRLRTLLNGMTAVDIINQIRRSYTAGIKN